MVRVVKGTCHSTRLVMVLSVTGILAVMGVLILFHTTDSVTGQGLGSFSGMTGRVYSHTTYLPVLIRQLPPYFDGFDDASSGWHTGPVLRYNSWCRWDVGCFEGLEEVTYLSYYNGFYRFYVPETWHGGGGSVDTWFVWPVETAPLPDHYYPLPENYCIETTGFFANFLGEEEAPYWAHWGIVFGATDSLSEVYTAQVNANLDYAILQYHNYTYPGNRQPLDGSEVNVEIKLSDWTGGRHWNQLGTHSLNRLRVAVHGDHVVFYVNDFRVKEADVPNMPRDRIGLIAGTWEVTPVDVQIDHFRYVPNCME